MRGRGCERDGAAGALPAAGLEIDVDQERRLVNIIINGKAELPWCSVPKSLPLDTGP